MRRLIAAVGATLVTAALTTTTTATAQAAPTGDAFYVPPAQLPAANGALVRTEAQPLSITIALQKINGKATRLMYKSTDAGGRPVAVTGSYIEPDARWTGSGPRPLVAFAPGTQGQGDACAPSKTLSQTINVAPGSLAVGYEAPQISALVDQGFGVVLTDYMGLGTPDRVHTYTTRLDTGHALLDAARAARNLTGTTLTRTSPIGLYGYSQGGGATGAAAELARTYAPELPIRGAYVGAPPADLFRVLQGVDGTSLTGVIGYAINGLVEYSPALRSILDAETNATGKGVLRAVSTQCVGDSLLQFGFQRTNQWTTSGQSAAQVVDRFPQARAVVDAQKLGKVRPSFPVLVVTGTQDDIVDHGQAKQVAVDWCARGASVQYRPVLQALPSAGTALNHLTPVFTEAGPARGWLAERLRGTPNASNCALVPVLP